MTIDQQKHVLVIYENTGTGHRKLAGILEQYLSNPNVRITLLTPSQLIKKKDGIFVRSWNFLLKKHWVFLADVWLNFIARIFFLPFYYNYPPHTKVLFSNLDSLRPDIIISTADVNRLFGSYCHARKIPFFIAITSGAIFVDMLSPHATHIVYFRETAEIIKHVQMTQYFKRDIVAETSWLRCVQDLFYLLGRYSVGYITTPYFFRYRSALTVNNHLNVKVIGPLREKAFYQQKTNEVIKNHFNIPKDGNCILITNGNFGGDVLIRIIKIIFQHYAADDALNLMAVCGSDIALYKQMQIIAAKMSTQKIRIIPIAAQNSLADLYQIADCSVGRGTAGILMDSVVSQTPLIVFKKVTTNDFGTLDIIQKYKIGAIAKSMMEIPSLLKTILLKKEQYLQALNNLVTQYEVQNVEAIQSQLQKIILFNKENSNE